MWRSPWDDETCLGICADTCAKLSLFKQSKFSKTRNGRWIKVNITLQAQKSAHCLYIVHYIIRTGFCKWEKLEESTGIFCRTISLIVFTHGASICSNKESCPAWLSSCPRLLTIISSLLGPTNRSLQRPDSRFALSTNGFYPDFTLWAKNWVALAHDQDCSVLEPFFFETVTALQCCQWDDGHLQKIENSLWQNLIFNCVQGRMKSLKG